MELSAARSCSNTTSFPWQSLSKWCVGIDIGQASDPTAFCAVERVSWELEPQWQRLNIYPNGYMRPNVKAIVDRKPSDELRVRALQRLPLGIPYPEQCELLASMLSNSNLENASVFLDATGVGKPISDLFRKAGIKHKPIWISGGRVEQQHGGGYSVPKLHLISRLQAALHSGELKIARALPEAAAFTRELQEFRVSWTEAGHARFGARQGAHDDLVLAAALAVYGATRRGETKVVPLLL